MPSRHLVSTITVAAALFGAPTFANAALSPNAPPNQTNEVLFNGTIHLSDLKRVTYTGCAWRVGSQDGAASGLKTYARPYFPPANLELTVQGVQALAQKLADFAAGREVRLSTQVRSPSVDSGTLEWTSLGDCVLAYFECPRFEAGGTPLGSFKVHLLPTAFIPIVEKSAVIAELPPSVAPTSAPFTQFQFEVSIPGVDCSHVKVVDGISIESAKHAVQPGDKDESVPASGSRGVANGNIRIEASGITSRGLQEWMLANQNGAPAKREISIRLLTPDRSTTLLTLRGVGLGLMSFQPNHDFTEGVPCSQSELFVDRWEVLPPGAPRSKPQLALPGAAVPSKRK